MEAYFETVSQVYFFTMDMLAAYCLFCLVKDFLRERRHAWFAGIAYFLALWVLYKTPYVFSNFVFRQGHVREQVIPHLGVGQVVLHAPHSFPRLSCAHTV